MSVRHCLMRINSRSLSSVTYTFYWMTLTVTLTISGTVLLRALVIFPAQLVHIMPDTWMANTLSVIQLYVQ